ncbi:MAG: tRNA (adenosine(37)-N6)-threonylcarbamoyltransferase complex transferase subunit TsaD, partial [Patescibacteria group bacterium]
TAMSVIETTENNEQGTVSVRVLSNVISSQVKLHAKYGGVVPSLAAREHVKNIGHVFNLTLKQAGLLKSDFNSIDLIAVTRGPGLGPALLVGLTFAKTIAWLYKKPLVGVNHLEGHIYSNWLQPVGEFSISNFQFPKKEIFPALNLIVSGGHTELVLMKNHGQYKIIGETMDDAVGEAFDKVARLLGLGYPGGPQIARHAEQFARNNAEQTRIDAENIRVNQHNNPRESAIRFPRPMEHSKNFNFSYSGLKTAVLYKIRDLEKEGVKLNDAVVNEICYEFQNAAIDVLIQKTMRAAKEYKVKSILLSGGVSANSLLRLNLNRAAAELGVKYFQPRLEYTGDNAAMIAVAGYYISEKFTPLLSARAGFKVKSEKLKTDFRSVKMDANLAFYSE